MAEYSINKDQLKKNPIPKDYDFVYCFRPFYYFSRIFGYMPFSINLDTNNVIYRPAINAFDILWFVFAIIVYISTGIACYIQMSKASYTSSVVLNNGGWLMFVLTMAFGTLTIVLDMYSRFGFVDILNRFNRIDGKV